MRIVEQYLLQLKKEKRRLRRTAAILSVLSFFVVIGVSWNLRMTGVTIANGAGCGLVEHQHTAECLMEKTLICELEGLDPPEEPPAELPEAPSEELPSDELTDEPIDEPNDEPTNEEIDESSDELTEETEDETLEEPLSEEVPDEPSEEESETEIPEEDDAVALTALTDEPEEEIPSEEEVPEEESAEEPAENIEAVHIHGDECYKIIYSCNLTEHIHVVTCYPDTTADLEDRSIWEATLPELTGRVSEDMVLVAQSQLGYQESILNFELAEDGLTRNGITRYGQWYGNPYGSWSNMFTSFCLYYAGLADAPLNSGAETMMLEWDELGLYRSAGSYEPVSGDIVFLDKNQNGVPESTAVVVSYFDFVLTVIEGDVENAVVVQEYRIDDPMIVGYSMTDTAGRVMSYAAAPTASAVVLGETVAYHGGLLNNGTFMIYTNYGGKSYALDGNGNAVEVYIDSKGIITADISDRNLLYWSFESANNYDNRQAFYIRNAVTGRYLHPNRDSSTYGPMHPDRWETALYNDGSGVRLRGARQDAYVQFNGTGFTISNTLNNGSVCYFGKTPSQISLWLDGTNGNIMSYRGSENTKYSVFIGEEVQLPTQWKSPSKYSYTLAGWVNIETGEYYKPGATISITKNTVLYADWVAATYDIGEYNSKVVDTVSTNDFITTRVFDYSSLINLLSTRVSANISADSHSETWSHVSNGTVSYRGQETLDFSFNDHDSSGTITNLNDLNDPNKYTGGNGVYTGIYTDELGDVLFGIDNLMDPETGEGIVGKHYLGEGDHLFQINTDPDSEYYGYYYYDAKLNAASYNQSDQRFYVYNYLSRASDSENNDSGEGQYSDFLPLNSPYANNNGKSVKTYSYAGANGEYSGVTHYSYDSRYDTENSNIAYSKANLWSGMSVDVHFGLPDEPGKQKSDGKYGNKDIYGNDMHFEFTGDDDVWILIDGEVVLDLGGIHQAASGDINFSTGKIRVNGSDAGTLSGIGAGEHTLTIFYLERGASMSNCGIYFNLAPRFSLTLEKEDVLTQEVLNGAQFAFYHDQACTDPCDLWESREDYKNGADPTNVFTIVKGKASIWGLSPSQTYYIREIQPPTATKYEPSRGVIRLTLDKNGLNSYSATILEEIDKNGDKIPISHGYTLHGFKIDEENQAASIVVTNAQNWVKHTTSVYVEKWWNDSKNHTNDSVTVYLNVTDPDGTVRRLREITLSKENDWKYTWTNLPKFIIDPKTMEESDVLVQYSVSEAYVPGYAQQITGPVTGDYTEDNWAESLEFVNGQEYVLKTSKGCLSAVAADKNTLCYVDEATARESSLALWTATVSSGRVKLTNRAGQNLTFYSSGSTRYYYVTTGSSTNFTASKQGDGLKLSNSVSSGGWYPTTYYVSDLNASSYAAAKTDTGSALVLHPMVKSTNGTSVGAGSVGYIIKNIPLSAETSLKVMKRWDHPKNDKSLYEKAEVPIRLLANGVDAGRLEIISLKNDWTVVFEGLPYVGGDGQPIKYTVVESWGNKDWIPVYGEVVAVGGGDIPTYEMTVTNQYRWVNAFELPETGGIGLPLYILCGLVLVSAPLVYGLSLKRKYERRLRE